MRSAARWFPVWYRRRHPNRPWPVPTRLCTGKEPRWGVGGRLHPHRPPASQARYGSRGQHLPPFPLVGWSTDLQRPLRVTLGVPAAAALLHTPGGCTAVPHPLDRGLRAVSLYVPLTLTPLSNTLRLARVGPPHDRSSRRSGGCAKIRRPLRVGRGVAHDERVRKRLDDRATEKHLVGVSRVGKLHTPSARRASRRASRSTELSGVGVHVHLPLKRLHHLGRRLGVLGRRLGAQRLRRAPR